MIDINSLESKFLNSNLSIFKISTNQILFAVWFNSFQWKLLWLYNFKHFINIYLIQKSCFEVKENNLFTNLRNMLKLLYWFFYQI